MDSAPFLSKFTEQQSVYLIRTEQPAPALLRMLVSAIARMTSTPSVRLVDLAQEEVASVIQRLAMTFLGATELYYLIGIDEVADKKIEQLLIVLSSYQGPHVVVVALPKELHPAFGEGIAVPNELTVHQVNELIALLEPDEQMRARTEHFFGGLYKRGYKFSLDEIARLLPYAQLVGARLDDFISQVLPKIISAEHSLFELGTAFFAHDVATFRELYLELSHEYQAPFWVTYFSEQTFRAYWFITYKQAGKLVEAQKVGYRLPFSFLQKDWRQHHKDELAALHDRLYQFDCDFKQGASVQGLDLLLFSYLTR